MGQRVNEREQLYRERLKRVEDAISLKVPDRVPVTVSWGFFPARYVGMSYEEYMYEPEKIMYAAIMVHEDFEPDMADNPFTRYYLGPILDALGFRQLRWPGRGLRRNVPYQFVEDEYMKPEEYDHFIYDPTDWIMRRYLPRICSSLEPLSKIAPIRYIFSHTRLTMPLAYFGTEEVQEALDSLKRAGEAALLAGSYARKFNEEMVKRGFPLGFGGATLAPFDALGDFFRGTRGIMVDMYRRPEKLLQAVEVLTPWMIEMGLLAGKASGNPRIFIPLHKGADSFMSLDQFKTFYWPSLRKLIVALIDAGMNPIVFIESDYTSRLELMRDIPAGKAVYWLENTDIFQAKEILGDRVCLRGNVPASLLCLGTPDEVKEYCKKLIDVVGKGGGFIMDASGNVEDAKAENVRAMIEFTKAYGRYH